MNIWAKMMTALRGGVNEAGEVFVDTQALRILDQEVRDASEELKQSRDGMAEIMARQKLGEEKISHLRDKISQNEGYARQALAKNEETLALEVAAKIADLEVQLKLEKEAVDGYKKSVNQLRTATKQAEANIKRIKHQVDTVKATENVQRAQAVVAERHSGSNSRLRTAMDSLERIKEKQALAAAQISAASEMASETSDQSLTERLEDAGIAPTGESADEILKRLRSVDATPDAN